METKINSQKTIKDILKVAFSNILNLLSGVLIGFIIPKIFGLDDYGYYKTFTLYISYVGLFHFGIEDGIYLIYGGKDFEELEKSKFRFYSKFLIILESIIAVLLILFAILVLPGEYKIIFVFVGLYLLSINISNYYQFISQITSRFTELSLINVIKSVLLILSVVAVFILYKVRNTLIDYRLYTLIYVGISWLITIVYIIIYRKLTFGKSEKTKLGIKDIWQFFKVGLPLLVANLCSTFILTIDRQFVQLLFTNTEYGQYAFAYNLLGLATTAISSIAVVIYPTLKKTNVETLKNIYSKLISIILILVFACMIIYFPLGIFIEWFLPQYTSSLVIFRIIFPGLAISSGVTIIMHNYYKTLGINTKFFIKSLVTLGIQAILITINYLIFKTTIALSISSICIMILWYIISEYYFIKKFNVAWKKNFIYMILMTLFFYLSTIVKNYYISGIIYIAAFIIFSLILYFKEIKQLLSKLNNKQSN